MTSVNLLLHNANHLFSRENVERLSNTLDNLQQTTGAIAEQRGDIKVVMQQLMSEQTGGRGAGANHRADA